MSDIAAQARAARDFLRENNATLIDGDPSLYGSLADDIERLRARVVELEARQETLREALEDIARGDYSDPMCKRTPEQRARDALAETAP